MHNVQHGQRSTAHPRVLVFKHRHDLMILFRATVASADLAPYFMVRVQTVFQDQFVCLLISSAESLDTINRTAFQSVVELGKLALQINRWLDLTEVVISLGSPGHFRELIRLRPFLTRRARQPQCFTRHGILEGHHLPPRVRGPVTMRAWFLQHRERSIESAAHLQMPETSVHKGTILLRFLLIEKTHGRPTPDLTDATAGMTGQHIVATIEPAHCTDITRSGIH